jgi:hypothetical protein
MKKMFFSVILTLLSIFTFSQSDPWETTIEEYNYVTKGYAVQLEQGLDMKAGYEFEDMKMGFNRLHSISTGDGGKISVEIKLLINKNKEHIERAIMVAYKYENEEGISYNRYLCIPNNANTGYSTLSTELWNKHFDEIKYYDSNDLLALTWAYSKVLSDNELGCFPSGLYIKMANGTKKAIQNITKGDTLISYNFENHSIESAIVDDLLVHSNLLFEISKINISISDNTTASINDFFPSIITLEATNNHPIFTNNGVKKFGDLNSGDKVYYYSEELNKVVLHDITSIEKNIKTTPRVYNLKLINSNNFIVNGTIVQTK